MRCGEARAVMRRRKRSVGGVVVVVVVDAGGGVVGWLVALCARPASPEPAAPRLNLPRKGCTAWSFHWRPTETGMGMTLKLL